MSPVLALAPVPAGERLKAALEGFVAAATCAPSTRAQHRENLRALLLRFGDCPVADFQGRRGGRLLANYLAAETGPRRRRPPRGRRGPLTYATVRSRLATLHQALELAVARGELATMPDPWPIPRPGAEGHLVARGRYVLADQAEEVRRRYPPRRREPPSTAVCAIPPSPLAPGATTLGEALAWLLDGGVRRRTDATQEMRAEHMAHHVRFFGAARPLADFEGPGGYRLLLSFVAAEGPEEGGRGVRYTTLRKRINSLVIVLKEAVKRGLIRAVPPLPSLPADSLARTRYLTFEEYESLRAALPPRWRLFLDLGCWTGQHTSDIEKMSWKMVDLGAGPGAGPGPGMAFFLRRNSKNRRVPEFLPMPAELRRRLCEAREADRRTDAPAIVDPDQCIVGRWHAARRSLRRACIKLGIPPVAPIDLRRTFATWFIDGGGPRDSLRRYMGHATTSSMIERHYIQTTALAMNEGVAALDRQARRAGAQQATAAPPALLPAKEVDRG